MMLFDLYFKCDCFVKNGWEDGERRSRGSWESSQLDVIQMRVDTDLGCGRGSRGRYREWVDLRYIFGDGISSIADRLGMGRRRKN